MAALVKVDPAATEIDDEIDGVPVKRRVRIESQARLNDLPETSLVGFGQVIVDAAAEERRGEILLRVAGDDKDGGELRKRFDLDVVELRNAEAPMLDLIEQVVRKIAGRLVDFIYQHNGLDGFPGVLKVGG